MSRHRLKRSPIVETHEPWRMNWMMTGGAALLNQVYHLFRSMMAMTMAGDGENRHQRRYVSRVVPES